MVLNTLALAMSVAALALVWITWRRLRFELQRSDARVAALRSAIDDGASTDTSPARPAVDADSHSDERAVSFLVPEPRRSGLPAALGVVVVLVALGAAALLAGRGGNGETARAADPAHAAPLELLSMRHTLDGDSLVVSGLVRNASSVRTPVLSAVVSAIDADGRVVARGGSRLDADTLDPGKETSFRVTVSDAEEVGRYRVGFVDGDRVVAHVDRRRDGPRAAMAAD